MLEQVVLSLVAMFAGVGLVAALIGLRVWLSWANRFVAQRQQATRWERLRMTQRAQFAEQGVNADPEQIPEGRIVAVFWEGSDWPEVMRREGNRLVNQDKLFYLEACLGWVDLPQLNPALEKPAGYAAAPLAKCS